MSHTVTFLPYRGAPKERLRMSQKRFPHKQQILTLP